MRYRETVQKYYDYTLPFYRVFWHGDTRALHYGIWDDSTKSLKEALLNTNRVVAEQAHVQNQDKVLDAGCGVGGSAFWLAQNIGAHVVGITLSERQLAKAKELRKRLHAERLTEFFLQDYTSTTFPDGPFDVVFAVESVCHVPHKEDFLREAYRLLRQGGRLVVADGFIEQSPQNDKEKGILADFLHGLALDNLASSRTFVALAKDAGFNNIKVVDYTDQILPTARKMARMCRFGWPFSVITTWLGLTPKIIRDNNRAGINQLYLVEHRLVVYQIFSATK